MHTTRERILTHLKRYPGAGVDALAQALELAPMTIRQQLTKLRGDGLVEARPERGRTGRPAHAFTLTAAGEEQFPKAYDRLARLLIEALPESGVSDGHGNRGANGSGETSRADLFRQMVVKAAEPHRERLERLQPCERVQEAVAILQDESGFT